MRNFRNLLLSSAFGAVALTGAGGQALATVASSPAVPATYQHVLLISVDGLHAVDLSKWIAAHPGGALAALAQHGVVYPNALTTFPSDSYPGMLAQVTGATPRVAGLFYDDSYDRNSYPSKASYTSQGLTDPGCVGNPGAEITNFEDLDKTYDYGSGLVADISAGGTVGQVMTQLDPDHMQRQIVNGQCVPTYPHQYVRTNTVFEVIKQAGFRTAWSDKHPAYEDLAGPSGTGLDELYAPEINSQDTLDAGAQPGDDYTKSFIGVRTYDALKVQAVLNWIDGKDGTGTVTQSVPAIFGMNFQAVSVGQKLAKAGHADADKSLRGGYLDAAATPGNALTANLQFVDDSIGRFESELQAKGLDQSTLIIISAKHGQSPINPKVRQAISDAGYASIPGFGQGFEICDDAALVWLDPALEKSSYNDAKAYMLAHAADLHIQTLFDRTMLTKFFGDPFTSSRVPDFIAVTPHGAICTGGSKLAEHGGFAVDDRNVGLLLSSPQLSAETVNTVVETTQIAPTILHALGISPYKLKAVQLENTPVLSH